MKLILNKIKKGINYLLGFLPSRLPNGAEEFESWYNTILATYTLPTMHADSIKFVLTTSIMHLGPSVAYKPTWYFVLVIRAAAAKQVAGAIFHDIKQRQKQAEATAQQVASIGQK